MLIKMCMTSFSNTWDRSQAADARTGVLYTHVNLYDAMIGPYCLHDINAAILETTDQSMGGFVFRALTSDASFNFRG